MLTRQQGGREELLAMELLVSLFESAVVVEGGSRLAALQVS